MPSDEWTDEMICAVKARTFLEQAKAELPGHEEKIDEAMQLLWKLELAAAKAIMVGLLEHTHDPPENLSHALMYTVTGLGESSGPLLNYIKVRERPTESDHDGTSA